MLAVFLDWTSRTGIPAPLQVPTASRPAPQVLLSDQQRWRHVERLLHDNTIRLYTRIGGLFLLLYAQPLSRICRMRADQITQHDGTVTVNFDTMPIELPEPLDQFVREHLSRRGQASFASRPDKWLFPGGLPGKHLATENIRSNSSPAASNPPTPAKPPCSNSPPKSPPRYSPTCSGSHPPPPHAGPTSPHATGATTPPCAEW